MADELHTPNHRWYEPRNHIPLAKEDHSKQWIFDSGIQKINAWIASQPWGSSVYAAAGFEPPLVADFKNEYYRIGGAVSTFDGVFTHDRSGNATMVDSSGNRKWAPHNLLRYSEDFSNAAWVKSSFGTASVPVVTANAGIAPDGTTTADRIVFDCGAGTTAGDQSTVQQTVSELSRPLKQSVWLKSTDGVSSQTIKFRNQSTDFSNVTVTGAWQEFTLDVTTAGGTIQQLQNSGNFGTAVVDVLVWGWHSYRSDLGGMVDNPDTGDSYVPTTSSARYLARRGNHVYNGSAWVNEGLLNESEARTNLVTYSNDFANADWLKSVSIDPILGVSPDGGNTASYVTGASSGRLYTTVIGITPGEIYTASVWVKNVDLTSRFDLNVLDANNGLVSIALQNFYSSLVIGSYVRLSLSFTAPAGCTTVRFYVGSTGSSSGWPLGESAYIYGAQLEAGSTPSSYIPTNSGSTVTRAADTIQVDAGAAPWPTPNVIGGELFSDFASEGEWVDNGDGSWTVTNATTNTDLRADGITTLGKHYQYSFDISTTAGLVVYTSQSGPVTRATGSYTVNNVATSGFFIFRAVAGATATVSNISVREIDPLAVSIQMDGTVTGDTQTLARWYLDANNAILQDIGSTDFTFTQEAAGVVDTVTGGSFTSGVNTAFNIASTHASTLLAAAVSGTALTDNTTPVALPDLSASAFEIGYGLNGNIGQIRLWADNITEAGREEATS